MKTTVLSLVMVLVLFVAMSQAALIYDNPAGGTIYAWNWADGPITHSVEEVDLGDGNLVIRHTGTVNNNTGAAANTRYGSKWDITVSGNTSADPADYTISFYLRNVSGKWDPIPLSLAVLTKEDPDQGFGYAVQQIAQADGWVRVEFNLADSTGNWWEGNAWDLTNPNWSLEVGMPWPGLSVPAGESWTQVWEMDNLKIIMGSDIEPHDPVAWPDNGDGTVGTLISQAEAEVTLGWMAGGDPNTAREYPVNPDTVGYYIYLSLGGEDAPNLYLLDYVEQVYAEDPYETDPYNEYGPILLGQSTTYYWQIEQAMDDGTGNPYDAGDPNNITGPVWSFTTIGATPRILSGPEHTVADFDGNASFSVTTGAVATHFRWFKVGDPDTQLADGGIYSGTQTDTLFITGAASDGSDDARVYAIAYNGDPEKGGIPSAPSAAAWFWYPRLVNHYPFETTYEVEEVTITPDIVSGYDAMLLSNDTGQDIPVLAAGMPELEGDFALKFDNPRGTDPNVADAQYAQVSEGWAGGYKDITISAWVYSSGGSNWNRILDFGNDTNNYMFLCVNPGSVNRQVRFAVKVAGNEQSVSSAAEALPDNTWVHVAATLTGTTGRIYINGELAGTNTSMTLDPVSYGPSVNNWIARSQWGAGDGYFNGMLDDLKIYNYARTTEQIAQDYLAVRGGWVCNYELYDLPYDFNGDCTVDLADFAIFAAAWLDNYRIYPE